MATALALAFCAMLVVTLGTFIVGSLYTAGENTRQLLTARINLTLDAIERGVINYLHPVEARLRLIRDRMQSGQLDPSLKDERTVDFLRGMLAAADQIKGVGVVERGVGLIHQERDGSPQFSQFRVDAGSEDGFFDWDSAGDRVVWGPPTWSPIVRTTVINARLRLDLGDGRERLVLAAIEIDTFARQLTVLANEVGQPVFVLHGGRWILGYNGFDPATADLTSEHPLVEVAEATDRVLAAFNDAKPDRLSEIAPGVNATSKAIEVDGVRRAIITRQVKGFTDLAWTIGTHVPASEAGEQVRRFMGLIALSLVVSLAAVVLTFWIGRRLSRPLVRLADFAHKVGDLQFDRLEPLPPSSIRELHTATEALNGMTAALKWFEAYVPRRLVQYLIRTHGASGVPSRELDVSVMFTDIVGFTRHTTGKNPAAVAAFLNHHFAILKECIEAEGGTIDKYIGDSVMAFWGAPEIQDDHAARACRAALAIRAALAADPGSPAIRIGIQSGPTLVGNIGAPGRLNYTLVGDTVNVAQRLEQLGKSVSPAERTTILIAAATFDHLRGSQVRTEKVGEMQMTGTDKLILVHRL
ncbi:MAG: hypothetical protein H6851_15930 [Geminicoccaceae bacterium]|nr:hypothetical protein [Geminicoccaceae bacterium]MCB9945095.1 hypothetical protein [Geminicoccaceae bacterium]